MRTKSASASAAFAMPRDTSSQCEPVATGNPTNLEKCGVTGVTATILIVATIACGLPASRLDPIVVLRDD